MINKRNSLSIHSKYAISTAILREATVYKNEYIAPRSVINISNNILCALLR